MSSQASRSEAAPASFHIPSLDGIRACAFLLVFLGHTGVVPGIPAGFGVTVFFFLSGYLITTLLRQEVAKRGSVDFKLFYLRRALRILPPFYLVFAPGVVDSLCRAATRSARVLPAAVASGSLLELLGCISGLRRHGARHRGLLVAGGRGALLRPFPRAVRAAGFRQAFGARPTGDIFCNLRRRLALALHLGSPLSRHRAAHLSNHRHAPRLAAVRLRVGGGWQSGVGYD